MLAPYSLAVRGGTRESTDARERCAERCNLRQTGHAWDVEQEPSPETRRGQEIEDRLDAIRARLAELRRGPPREPGRGAASMRLARARNHAATAEANAAKVFAAGGRAFRRAAEAHERAAEVHERSAASGIGDKDEHLRLVAFHRRASEADRERAERADSLVPGNGVNPSAGARRLEMLAERGLDRVAEIRLQLEAELQRAERMQTLGQLAAAIAHDFANMLAVIVGYAEMAEEAKDDELHRILGEIRLAAERGVRMSSDLLRFCSRTRARPEPVDLETLITDARNLLAVGMNGRAEVVFRPSPVPLPAVRADPHQLEQVLLNLAVNARDAMPDGGTLTISTMPADLTEKGQGARRKPGAPARYVELAVKDTGTGMSPEVRAKIFDRFFTTKPPDTGTGLGLSTVHGIISSLGGTIEVDSEPGLGTTFRIYLPAMRAPGRRELPAARQVGRELPVATESFSRIVKS